MEEIISVIVPIYNAEKYLKKCVDSILQQSYKKLEIILIDDGSTDKSSYICDEYLKSDSRIKVIHQENQGLSAARNVGIDMACGKYISFIDSDDFIKKDMLEILYYTLVKENADLAICDIRYVDGHCVELNQMISPISNNVFSSEEIIDELFEDRNFYYVVAWNKLYKRKLWDGIRYPIGFIHEDEAVIHRIYSECDRIVTVKKTCYYYRQVNNSIMHRSNVTRTDKYFALADRLVFLENKISLQNAKRLSYQFWYHYLEDFFKYYPEKANKKYIGRMKKALYAAMPIMARCGFLTKKDTISLRIFLFSPTLYKKLFMK